MTKGVLLIAQNNEEIDYIKQAAFLSRRVKQYLDLPTSIITDDIDYIKENNLENNFDKIISPTSKAPYTSKSYKDGVFEQKTLSFKNADRAFAYDLTPYDETLLIDTDLVVTDSVFAHCFEQSHNLMMYSSNAVELSGWRNLSEFDFISDTGPNFYWATAVFFRKSSQAEIFFNLVKHIQENWGHYKTVYQLMGNAYRNDFSFSIAAHMLNGFQPGDFVKQMPGTLYYSLDKDELIELKDDSFLFLVEKKDQSNLFPVRIKGKTVHVMNKYSLERIINGN